MEIRDGWGGVCLKFRILRYEDVRNFVYFTNDRKVHTGRSPVWLAPTAMAEQCELAFRQVPKYSSRSNDSAAGCTWDRNRFSAVGGLRNSTHQGNSRLL